MKRPRRTEHEQLAESLLQLAAEQEQIAKEATAIAETYRAAARAASRATNGHHASAATALLQLATKHRSTEKAKAVKQGKFAQRQRGTPWSRRPKDGFNWERVHQYIAEHGPTGAGDLTTALKVASLSQALADSLKYGYLVKDGRQYHLGPVPLPTPPA